MSTGDTVKVDHHSSSASDDYMRGYIAGQKAMLDRCCGLIADHRDSLEGGSPHGLYAELREAAVFEINNALGKIAYLEPENPPLSQIGRGA
jgi:hypothetical protein